MTKPEQLVVAIIGGGFCGLMTAINLIEKANLALQIVIINDDFPTAKGVAFSAHTSAYLLNVPASNMSCFADDLRHFLRWLQQRDEYKAVPENLLERMFVPRKLYGKYLQEVWKEVKESNSSIRIEEKKDRAIDIKIGKQKATVFLQSGNGLEADYVVLATGNEKPADVKIDNPSFYKSQHYFANPWQMSATKDCGEKGVLIIGNGLTMVDTVLGLLENKYSGTIYSLSPNGFSLLPHISNGVLYKEMLNELALPYSLPKLFSLFKKHIRLLSQIGLSAEPVIDSVRVKTQEIWASLNLEEKRRFLRHIKYKWGIARHRIPAHIHRKLQQLRIDKKLVCYKAILQNLEEKNNDVLVTFYNKETKAMAQAEVFRVINCTGPVCNITRSDNPLLKQLVERNLIVPDPLHLGINATYEGAVINGEGEESDMLFTLGSHMKGILWESTAVPDLRVQAERLSALLLDKITCKAETAIIVKQAPSRFKTKHQQFLKKEELIEYYI